MQASEYHSLYDKALWKRLRKQHLQANPLCVYCLKQGVVESASIVDHIKPHKGDKQLFYDTDNFQSLCKSCHDKVKAIQESRGYMIGNDVTGAPIDHNHHWNGKG